MKNSATTKIEKFLTINHIVFIGVLLTLSGVTYATSPQITTLSPSNNATNIGLSGDFVITFDQSIDIGFISKNINIIDEFTENILFSYSINSSVVSISGNTLTFSPPGGDLEYNRSYYINLEAGAVKNSSDQYFGGMGYSDWLVSTGPDQDPPVLLTFFPDHEATGITTGNTGQLRSVVSLQFHELVQITGGNLLIKKVSDDQIDLTVDLADPSNYLVTEYTSTFWPYFSYLVQFYSDVRLANSTEYYVELADGVIQDANGNNFAGFTPNEWTFITAADDQSPTATAFTPADNATGTNLQPELIINFNEAVQEGSGNILIKRASNDATIFTIGLGNVTINNNLATISLPSALDPLTEYYVEFGAGVFNDLSNNDFSGITAGNWSFTTGDGSDLIPPQLVALEPANGAGEVYTTNLTMTFDEPIQKGIGTIYVKDFFTDVVVYSVNVAASEVSTYVIRELEISDFALILENNKQYYVEFASGVVEDVDGNPFPGIAKGDWVYSTRDTVLPDFVSLSPADESVGVALDATFTLELTEKVFKHSSGKFIIRETATNFPVHTFFTQTVDVTINDNVVTFVLPGAGVLSEGTEYFIDVNFGSPSGLKDTAGNFFLGVDNNEWNFRTFSSDVTGPQISGLNPTDNAIEVATDADLQITFDEPIRKATGTIDIYKADGDELFRSMNISSSEITISGNTLIISPFVSFSVFTEYYVQMGGVVEDFVDNPFGGISSTDWSFRTVDPGDISAPQYTNVYPFDDSSDVPIATDLTIFFDEDIEIDPAGSLFIRSVATNSTVILDVASTVEVNGNLLTINPTSDLITNTELYVQMLGVVKDLAGNYFAGFAFEDYRWSFTTAPDVTPPGLVSTYPAFGETDVPIDADFTIEFDENVLKGTALSLWDADNNTFIELLLGSEVSVSNNVMTINPESDLIAGKSYFIRVTSTAVRDVYSNYFEGLDDGVWNFTAAGSGDVSTPLASSFTPLDEAIDVNPGDLLSISFNEAVVAGSGNIMVRELATSNLVALVTASEIAFSGSNASFDLSSVLMANGTSYYVEIPTGVITDLAGNAFAGFTGNSNWNFTTIDSGAPFVVDQDPAEGALEITLDGAFGTQFSETITEGSGSFCLRLYTNDQIIEQFEIGVSNNYNLSGDKLTITPGQPLEPNTRYYLTICASCIQDLTGNSFTGLLNKDDWDFTTLGEDVAPELAIASPFSPTDDAIDVAVGDNLVITFNEDVQFSGSGFAQLKFASGSTRETFDLSGANVTFSGNTVTLNPTNNLIHNTAFYVTISNGAIEDLANNPFGGISSADTWNFTTEAAPDNNPPVVTSLSPYDNQTHVAVDADLVMYFHENIQKGTGDIVIKEFDGDATIETIDVNSGQVSVSGNNVTINPTSDLANLTEYYVEIASGVIKDLAGNASAEISKPDWSFTTIVFTDTTPPGIVSLDPIDGATDLSNNFNLTITFDEPIVKGAGFVQIYDSDDVLFDNMNINNTSFVTFTENSVTFNPDGNLSYNTTYYMTISTGIIMDLSNNSFTMVEGDWEFTTATSDTHNPSLIDLTPADGSENLSLTNLNVFMYFDEDIIGISGDFNVRRNDNDEVVYTRLGNQLLGSGNLLWYPIGNFLEKGTEYYIQVDGDAITDGVGNPFDGIIKGEWHFSTEPDTDSPTIQTYNPAVGSGNISVTKTLALIFNEKIQKGTGNILLRDNITGDVLDSYNISDTEVSIINQEININPSTNLNYETNYNIEIDADAIQDLAGNSFAGLFDGDWTFTTVDKLSQIINFPAITDKAYASGDFVIGASSNSTLPVTLEVIDGPIELNGTTVSILGTGDATIRASQPGNEAYNAAIAVERTFSILKADQNVTFSALPLKVFGDDSFELSASNDSGQGVNFEVVDGPIFIVGNEVHILGAETATIRANHPGNDNYNPSNSVQRSLLIQKATQTITFDPPSEKTFGDEPFQLVGSSTSGLQVGFEILSGPATLDGNEITITGTGSVNIRASQPGDDNYWNANNVDRVISVIKADQMITFTEVPNKVFGDTEVTLDANSDSSLPVSFSIQSGPGSISNDNILNFDGAGTIVVRASQSGDANYNSATIDQTIEVAKADQIITLQDFVDRIITAPPFDIEASVDSGEPLTYSVSGPATNSGVTVTLTGSTGTVTVTVTAASTADYNAAQEQTSFEVTDKLAQTITFTEVTDKIFGDEAVTLEAIASSSLPVTFSVESGPGSITGDYVLNFDGAGTIIVRASQAGDDTYNATFEDQTIKVAKADQSITITAIPDMFLSAAPFDIEATVDTGLPLTYSVSGPATNNGATVTLSIGIGTVTVTVNQVGNVNYNAAQEQTTFEVTDKLAQTISFTTIGNKTFGDASVTLEATADSGLTPVTFSVQSGPGSISNDNVLNFDGAGTIVVRASQAGDET
ncbi:MAG: Ig-like domain-containing protein, partial [Cyclobacteriaceae bacterium]